MLALQGFPLLLGLLAGLCCFTNCFATPNNYYQAEFQLDSSVSDKIIKYIPHFDKPVALLGIVAISASTPFGLTLQKEIIESKSKTDELIIRALFTKTVPQKVVNVTVAVLIFQRFSLLDTFTVNLTSTEYHIMDKKQLEVGSSSQNYAVLFEGFETSNNNFSTRLVSTPNDQDGSYSYSVLSDNSKGWVLATFVIIEDSIKQICSCVLEKYMQSTKVNPLQKIKEKGVSAYEPHIIGVYRTLGSSLDFNVSQAGPTSHIHNGSISVAFLKLDLTCIKQKFYAETETPKKRSVDIYKVLMGVSIAVLGVLLIVAAAICYSRYRSKQQKKVRIEPPASAREMLPASEQHLRQNCRICHTAPSNVILLPCHHQHFCEACIAKLQEEQGDFMMCPTCNELVTSINHQ